MKSAGASLLVFLLTCASPAAPSRHAGNSGIWISGHEYVQVADWAKQNGFNAHWLKHDETLEMVSSAARITLNVDSCEAEYNGVGVRLLYPVVDRNGTPLFAQLDAQATFHPLLFPPRNAPRSKLKTICLDPGHGGRDPGFQVGSRLEKKYTLLMAQELRDQLNGAGFKVSLTRTRDTYPELPDRPALANRRKADLFVSLHFNAFPASPASVQGVEVYSMTPVGGPSSNARGEGAGAGWFPGNQNNDKNMLLAYQLQKSLTRGLGATDRGAHRARYWVLRDATMPAVLIEGGFLSHPVEGRKIIDPAYRRQMAKAIVDGIQAYKRIVERPG